MDWQALENQTADLVAQDYQNFPRVQRDLSHLHQAAEVVRTRTSKLLDVPHRNAAARMLAYQGVDGAKLSQDVTSLQLQPTVGDMYPAEPASLEDYLRQLEETSLLNLLEESQQYSVSSFNRFMDECMAREREADKAQLFRLIAPNSGSVAQAAGAIAAVPGLGPSTATAIAATAAGAPKLL